MGNWWSGSGSGTGDSGSSSTARDSGAYMGNRYGLDKSGLENRSNQLNPNHAPTGPGRTAGYHGAGTKDDLDNRANQMNPNNSLYRR